MIVYFSDRHLNILGIAHTNLGVGYRVIDDRKKSNVDNGVSAFELTISFNPEDRTELETIAKEGNYILKNSSSTERREDKYSINGFKDSYTIVETETDVLNGTLYIYAESVGLDLLNDLAPSYSADNYYTVDHYISQFISDKGFYIRNNNMPVTTQLMLSWTSSENVISRLNSIAASFECEFQFGVDIRGMAIVGRWIDIYKEMGADTNELMTINTNLNNIRIKRSMANVATALYATGKDGVSLLNYNGNIPDEDFYISGPYLMSRSGLEKWSRPLYDSTSTGHIYRTFSCDAATVDDLLSEAIKELKKRIEPEVNYEIDIADLPDGIQLGDRVNVVDRYGDLYLSSRVLQLEESECNRSVTAVLGEYLIKKSGISDKVRQLAEEFKNFTLPDMNMVDVQIHSEDGTTIKNREGTVRLYVNIYYKDLTINNFTDLLGTFGENAHLKWYRNDEEIQSTISEYISDDGFKLDVKYISSMQATTAYRVELIY